MGPVLYCIEWATWGPHIAFPTRKKKSMWGIGIILIQQCDVMQNNLGAFPMLLVCITICIAVIPMQCIGINLACIAKRMQY
jgi:hypothetical protein